MKLFKKWWFWAIIVLFVLVNLWITNDHEPANPGTDQPQLRNSNVGTH
ncbi:MAG TPA: hypothetical protein VFK33_09250 [Bacillales bacterium]|nr:hypothetical protein [Bacillales bacterium]